MTQFSTISIEDLPREYQYLFNEIPKNELALFEQFMVERQGDGRHKYLIFIESINNTIDSCQKPSDIWHFIHARLLFISANYQKVLDMDGFFEDDRNRIFHPFIARILVYQNRFDEANQLCEDIITSFDLDTSDLLTILTFYEACFSVGLSHVLNRHLEQLGEVINLLSSISGSDKITSKMPDHNYCNLSIMESLLVILQAFASGNTSEMRKKLLATEETVNQANDPWIIGYYYNLYTISYSQAQESDSAIEASKLALQNFQVVRDLRGVSTVGINLGVTYMTQGNHQVGREYLEEAFEPLIQLENYSLAITHMLQVAKSYLDENEVSKATKYAIWAEYLSNNIEISDPGTFAHLCYFYSRIQDIEKSDFYLEELRKLIFSQTSKGTRVRLDEISDVYSALWLYSAEGVNMLAKGNLELAANTLKMGVQLADNNTHFDFSMELSILVIEILLKQYMLFGSQKFLKETFEIMQDLKPLIGRSEISYFKVIFELFMAYLLQAMGNNTEATNWHLQAQESVENYPNPFVLDEIKRFDDISNLRELKNEDQEHVITDDYISILTVLESLRLLRNLQFQTIGTGATADKAELPLMLLIINSLTGLSIYDHKFKDTTIVLNEILISGFLSAISGFSKSIFGEGEISSIRQGERVILMDYLDNDNYLVLILEDESYLMRKKLRQYSKEVEELMLLDSIDFGSIVQRTDLNKRLLDKLTEKVFYD